LPGLVNDKEEETLEDRRIDAVPQQNKKNRKRLNSCFCPEVIKEDNRATALEKN
jgi:hypothetical protein